MRLLPQLLLAAFALEAGAFAQIVFEPPVHLDPGVGATLSRGLVLGDVTGDGLPDAIVIQSLGGVVMLLANEGNGVFAAPIPLLGLTGVDSLALMDVDGDDRDDVLARIADEIVVCRSLGGGSYLPPVAPYNDTPPFAGANSIEFATGDVTGDDIVDLIVVSNRIALGASRIDVLPGLGNGDFDTAIMVAESQGSTDYGPPAVADLDADGRDDIVVTRVNASGAWVFLTQPGRTWATAHTGGPALADRAWLVDVNGEGSLDIVTLTAHRRTVAIALGDGTGQFEPIYQVPAAERARDLIVANLDLDDHVDLAVTDDFDGSVPILKGRGDGTFDALTPANASTPIGLEVASLDDDGHADLAVIGPEGLDILLSHVYSAGSPYLDVGHGLKGSFGYPVFLADGSLKGGEAMAFRFAQGAPGGYAWFVLGLIDINLPFAAGGVMVPAPDLVIGPFVLPATGKVEFEATWPTGLSYGVRFWMQFWIQDPFATTGYAASTGVRAVTQGD